MAALILRRLATAAVLMLGAAVVSFGMLYLAPGSPAEAIIRTQTTRDATAQEIASFDERHDLDATLPDLALQWLRRLGLGDLGDSLRTGEPVLAEFTDRFPATLELAAAAMLIAVALAVPLGVLSAYWHGSVLDHVCRVLALLAICVPGFWMGLMLILTFCVGLGWLPCFGRGGAAHLALPALTLGAGIGAVLTRLLRASMLEVLGANYVRTARAKGLRERAVLVRHALRNASVPVVTIMGLEVGHLLTGTVIVETVFGWPGVGQYFVQAISARDYPVVRGFVLAFALVFVLANLAVDIGCAYLDPRARHAPG
ncbi:MAG: ABC transporter permease [Egibacteraceae bacterium]